MRIVVTGWVDVGDPLGGHSYVPNLAEGLHYALVDLRADATVPLGLCVAVVDTDIDPQPRVAAGVFRVVGADVEERLGLAASRAVAQILGSKITERASIGELLMDRVRDRVAVRGGRRRIELTVNGTRVVLADEAA